MYTDFHFPKFLLTLGDSILLTIFQSNEYEIMSHGGNICFPDFREIEHCFIFYRLFGFPFL